MGEGIIGMWMLYNIHVLVLAQLQAATETKILHLEDSVSAALNRVLRKEIRISTPVGDSQAKILPEEDSV
jgi:hypothetical protein